MRGRVGAKRRKGFITMSKKKTPAATPAKPKAAKKANAAPQGANDAPTKGKVTTKLTPAAKAPKAALVVTAFVQPQIESGAKEVKAPRAESKGAKILELISGTDGATLAEIMTATGWQKHSVRGFISTAGKKLTIESTKSPEGERTYRRVTP
jgi:hypothetical protein